MPGKCFIAGALPPASSPLANASAIAAVTFALKDHVRPSWYMNEAVVAGTSATGDSGLLTPAHASAMAVALPWFVVVVALSSVPIRGTETVGGAQGTRLTEPPSWSVV